MGPVPALLSWAKISWEAHRRNFFRLLSQPRHHGKKPEASHSLYFWRSHWEMAVYLARSCPMCRNYFGVMIGGSKAETNVRPIRGRCANCGYEINWTLLPGLWLDRALHSRARVKLPVLN